MTLVLPNAAEDLMLQNWLNKTAPQNCMLRLYTNDQTPGEADTEADYTEMGAVQGYAAIELAGTDWTITPGAPTSAAYAEQVFTFTAGGPTNIYGYFVTEKTSGKLKWAERFVTPAPPWVVVNAGDQIKITAKFTLE